MSTDRELLEAAARAAGIPISRWEYDERSDTWMGARADSEEATVYWKPIANDGDALRLAVKLGIDLQLFAVSGTSSRPHDPFVRANVDRLGRSFAEQSGGDPYAATKRAIVRAAAAMGEA